MAATIPPMAPPEIPPLCSFALADVGVAVALEEIELLGGVTTNGGGTEVGETDDDEGTTEGLSEEGFADEGLADEGLVDEGLADVGLLDVGLADAVVLDFLSASVGLLLNFGGSSGAAAALVLSSTAQ
jgi:hypothetical protein